MQETRQYILDILRVKKQVTVDELVGELEKRRGVSITAVTVRHHLNELLKEQLITTAEIQSAFMLIESSLLRLTF